MNTPPYGLLLLRGWTGALFSFAFCECWDEMVWIGILMVIMCWSFSVWLGLARCALQLVALLACTPFFLAMLQVRNENLHKSTLLSNEYLLCYMSVMCRDAAKGRHERSFKPRQVRHVNIPVRPAVVNVNNSLLRCTYSQEEAISHNFSYTSLQITF
ncbi:hypothetical protein BKA65DRAFT_280476 [Rhexocercosporidium sp. MPI-PUGE-AT-0058]|nr:hypothetical protein BKA65DRAFT_280476 [Rhexocercosporidium sp. MPI-PUGE-AT-0058]